LTKARAAAAGLLTAALLAGCAAAGAKPTAGPSSAAPTSGAAAPQVTTTTFAAPATSAPAVPTTGRRVVRDPGRLPQTKAFPTATSAHLRLGVRELWDAIITGDPAKALPFFFPVTAYVQAKSGTGNVADWHDRLWYLFSLDVAAVHQFVDPARGATKLLGVDVPSSQAQWVLPGEEFNKEPYWRLWGTVMRFRSGDRVGSFGVFQLISWRGEWYVVHLGPAVRSADVGIVWDPEG